MTLRIEARAASRRASSTRTATLALSGGTDSATLLFAMLATGRKPRCYTFYVEGNISSDLLASRALTKHFGLELVEVMIPWSIPQLLKDIREIIPACEVIKQTIVQCMHPWLYIYPAMAARQDLTMFNGLGGDDHFCMQRKVSVLLNTEGEQAVKVKGWRHCFGDDLNFSPANIHRWGAKRWAINNRCLYFFPAVEEWFCRFPIKELHRSEDGRALEKAASLYAFEDYYSQGPFRRYHDSYQKNSGLQRYHEILLGDPETNPRGSKAMISIYNDVANGRL